MIKVEISDSDNSDTDEFRMDTKDADGNVSNFESSSDDGEHGSNDYEDSCDNHKNSSDDDDSDPFPSKKRKNERVY